MLSISREMSYDKDVRPAETRHNLRNLPMRMCLRFGVLVILMSTGFTLVQAADEPVVDAIKPQKEAVAKVQTLLKLPSTSVSETKNLFVVSDLTAEKAKVLAPTLEKAFVLATTALDFTPEDKTWEGKLSVYLFADRDKFEKFVEDFEKRPLSGRDESFSSNLAGAAPHLAVTVGRGEGPGSLEMRTGTQMAIMLLQLKSTVKTSPEWVREGFGRSIMTRANPAKYAADRNNMRKLSRLRVLSNLWAEKQPEDTYLVGASFMDFLAFGMPKGKIIEFVKAYVPGENDEKPDWKASVEAIGLTPQSAEIAWKRWAPTAK